MNDKDRIRLAEFIGLRCSGCTYIETKRGTKEFAPDACCEIHGHTPYGFYPDTDANDDYAVLEHMLNDPEISTDDIDRGLDHLGCGNRWAVEPGIWAKVKLCLMDGDMESCEDCAALKVLDNDN